MLVLTRKTGQSLRIGDDIIIKIIDVDGSQVKIGIEAPKGVVIFREELYEKLKESNIEALKSAKELKLDELILPSNQTDKALLSKNSEKTFPSGHSYARSAEESHQKGEKE